MSRGQNFQAPTVVKNGSSLLFYQFRKILVYVPVPVGDRPGSELKIITIFFFFFNVATIFGRSLIYSLFRFHIFL